LRNNAFANRVAAITFSINNIVWLPGQQVVLSWTDVIDTANDHGLAIDNFNFVAVPEPTTFGFGLYSGSRHSPQFAGENIAIKGVFPKKAISKTPQSWGIALRWPSKK
jgi:hypothetical protein